MVNYQNGKIYKLVCNSTGLVYFGSTCENTLARRLAGHTKDYKRGIKISSTKIIENGNYGIFLVETYPCNSKDELNMRERFYIENNDCVNKLIPIRTEEEKKLYEKEYNAKHHPEYYEQNKTKLLEYNKNYREENKDKIREIQKQYRNKEEAKVRHREANKRYCEKEETKVKRSEAYKREDVKAKKREADKRYQAKLRTKTFFLNYLKCFNV